MQPTTPLVPISPSSPPPPPLPEPPIYTNPPPAYEPPLACSRRLAPLPPTPSEEEAGYFTDEDEDDTARGYRDSESEDEGDHERGLLDTALVRRGAAAPPRARILTGWCAGNLFFGLFGTQLVLAYLGTLVLPSEEQVHVGSVGKLFHGDCGYVDNIDAARRALLAVVSVGMLTAVSYTAQIICAPTRNEVDKLHAAHEYADIGLLSRRNLRNLSLRRKTHVAMDYTAAVVTESFLHSDPGFDNVRHSYDPWPAQTQHSISSPMVMTSDVYRIFSERKGVWEVLSPDQCISAYVDDYRTKYRHLLAVTRDQDASGGSGGMLELGVMKQWQFESGNIWMCRVTERERPYYAEDWGCNPRRLSGSDWRLGRREYKVDHCLAERLPADREPQCKIGAHRPIFLVASAGVMLLAAIIWETLFLSVAKESRMGPLLLTPGDAIESFLETQDETTEGMSTFSKLDFEYWDSLPAPSSPRVWLHDDEPWRAYAAVSRMTWTTYDLLIVFAFIGTIVPWAVLMINHDTNLADMSVRNMFRMGLGQTNPISLLDKSPPFIFGTFIAAAGLVLWSICFLLLQNILASISLTAEVSAYAFSRKGLRCSRYVRGQVCSGVYLSISPRIATKVFFLATATAYILSSSLFNVNITYLNTELVVKEWNGRGTLYTIGWSSPAFILMYIFTPLLLAVPYLFGKKWLRWGAPPCMGGCSASISAACHAGTGAGDKGVKWGVCERRGAGEVRRCGFSGGRVKRVSKRVNGGCQTSMEVTAYA
ncbi:hypothetical protein L873DRAFT_1845965 [Choiromyces venosus 120613-1]|uniref:DUF6536 domain-containing protein n=1 Tax=Choiromyces venosus 120613-1 TaxID=1336337 RepID=A0A3N4JB65_9PEZI|nr:hypothetical protein L873DRAFT_1845965 [Choiromyces venosus 120613-1]